MLLEQIKPSVFATKSKVQELARKHGIPSQEVLSALAGKKKKCDLFKSNLKEENLPTVKTPSVSEIAEKHKCSVKKIESQLKQGLTHELEHTKKRDVAREIALDHIAEDPDYYTKLKEIEH